MMWDISRKIQDDKKLLERCLKWTVYKSRNCLRTICERAKCKVKNREHAKKKLQDALNFFDIIKDTKLFTGGKDSTIDYLSREFLIHEKSFLYVIATNNEPFIKKMRLRYVLKRDGFSSIALGKTVKWQAFINTHMKSNKKQDCKGWNIIHHLAYMDHVDLFDRFINLKKKAITTDIHV
ncbi:MAG: hypothetical protein GY714_14085 [Desulfobacterales bacterium]|nr:hypothetical protein [Desulfobacterales bacterium]